VNSSVAGPDPFRISQLDVELWVDNGYRREGVEEYFEVINTALGSENAVTDIRFPTSSSIYAVLDEEVHAYLNGTITGSIPESDRKRARKATCMRIEEKFQEIIYKYDSQASTRMTALEQYQKLRNVYTVEQDPNQLDSGIRAYGFAIASVTMVTAIGFAIWTYKQRTSPVVRASQPFFLILICSGVFVLASSIFPLAIDDGFASQEACDRACMAIPWLVAMGWSILFAALYAKIRRVNLVIRNAMAFRSITVSERDVMLPFAVLFTSNLILLTVWTIYDPLTWVRIQTSETTSYGTCKVQASSDSWKIIVSFLGVLNGAALIASNVEAYKGRNVDTDYGESSYIALIMGSFLQIVLVGVPLYFLVYDNPTAKFFVSSSMVFLICMSVLLLLFIPKWRNWIKKPIGVKDSRSLMLSSGVPGNSRPASADSQLNSEVEPACKESLYEIAWKTRVHNLERIMLEAGIDSEATKNCLREAQFLDSRDQPALLTSVTSYSRAPSAKSRGTVAFMSSLNAVSEAPSLLTDHLNNGDDQCSMVSPEARQEMSPAALEAQRMFPPNGDGGRPFNGAARDRRSYRQPVTSVHVLEGLVSEASSIHDVDGPEKGDDDDVATEVGSSGLVDMPGPESSKN
jgi:7 transmembrane sweet-taste receptor of 3 GCPR